MQLKPLKIGDLEIKIPIIQGAMGIQVSTSALAAAVAEAGGAGTISSVGLGMGTEFETSDFKESSRKALANEIEKAKKKTKGVVGVNILVALTDYAEHARIAAKSGADFIAAGAGLPLKLPELTRGFTTKLIPIVSSAKAALLIMKTWQKKYDRLPDAFIVEGPKAGGHLGYSEEDIKNEKPNTLENAVKEVIEAAKDFAGKFNKHIPVIAAGGIFDGKDIAKFIKLGADGVQMATRFVATFECSVSEKFKELYKNAQECDLRIIKSPVGMPGRVINTPFSDKVNKGEREKFTCRYQCLKTCNPAQAPYCICQALFEAVKGNMEKAIAFAGSNVYRVSEIVSVKELIDSLAEEAEQAITGASAC